MFIFMFLPSFGLQYRTSLNKFSSHKQALATWINVSATMTVLRSFLDLQVIGKETLFSQLGIL